MTSMKNILVATVVVLGMAVAALPSEVKPEVQRTVKVKIAVDEEFRRRPYQFLETRKWVNAASQFFEKNFGVDFQVDELKSWNSDNSKGTFSGLIQNLYEKMDRGESDIVLGFTGQIRGESEVSGVASYRHGYALVKRMKNEYLIRVTVVHEFCHLFGAVDLENERSVMNKDEPQLECDEFTRAVICLHKNRPFDAAVFPLSAKDMDSAIDLYRARKSLNRGEAGVPLILAIFYLEMKDYEGAIRECLEAEKLTPQDQAVQRLLRLAQERK